MTIAKCLRIFYLTICIAIPCSSFGYTEDTHEILSDRALLIAEDVQFQLFPSGFSYGDAVLAIRRGVRAEDATPRFLNHFFNPDSLAGLLVGERSPNWIIDGSRQPASNRHSHGTAIDNYYLALTAQTISERRASTRQLFTDLGHVVHHIQDMAQPQHTRLDDHCPHPACLVISSYKPSAYEALSHARKLNFYDPSYWQNAVVPYSKKSPSAVFKTVRDFWFNRSGTGMAQYSSTNFVTVGTNFNYCQSSNKYCSHSEFPFPVASATQLSTEFTSPRIREQLVVGPYPDDAKNQKSPVSTKSIYTGSAEARAFFSLNSIHHSSAIKALIPKAIGYSAAYLNFFFRGQIDASTDSAGNVSIKNNGPELPGGTFELHYDSADSETRSKSSFSWHISGGLPRGATIPTSTAVPDVKAKIPNKFLLVFRGTDGPADTWMVAANEVYLTKSYIVPVDPVGTWLRVDTERGIVYKDSVTGEEHLLPDVQKAPTRVALSDFGAKVGDTLSFESLGGVSYNACSIGLPDCVPHPDAPNVLAGRFVDSGGNTVPFLYSPNTDFPAVYDWLSQPTCTELVPTNIVGDFLIDRGQVQIAMVPPNAVGIEFSVDDCWYKDNGDPNGDFKASMRIIPPPNAAAKSVHK